jgi:thymidylate synthase (FAD)
MKIVEPGFEIMALPDGETVLKLIELAGRTCYKSESRITPDSSKSFAQTIMRSGHEAVIEHVGATVRFICDRGVSHEIVRHRLAAYCQESTRYCNYGKADEITVIRPLFWAPGSEQFSQWQVAMSMCEQQYMYLLQIGATPQEARSVLPNSLKTEVVMTANMREWRHFFKMRAINPKAHPQMRQIAMPLLTEFQTRVPVLFDDIQDPREGQGAKG